MLISMTGFGKAEVQYNSKIISIEIKSLNSKQLDLNVKLPYTYRDKEFEIRNKIANKLQRGKVDFYVSIEDKKDTSAVPINPAIFKSYLDQIKEISQENKISIENESLIQAILRLPDVLKVEKVGIVDEEWEVLFNGIEAAINNILEFRKQEGSALETDIKERIQLIERLLSSIEPYEQQRIDTIKNRITENLANIKGDTNIDSDRFEQELIYYLEKMDITEEKVRLRNHCKYFIETMKEDQAVGRKLGFITQEIGREINTIGSKANQADIQKIVVLMKDELEKIKEQGMNIL